jgi:nucleoid DNA-binding protein
MNAKVTMPDLVAQVAESTRTTKRMSELFLRELFATITQSLLDGESVSVDGLGTFKADATVGVTFTPAAALARVLNQPFEAFEPVELSDDLTNDMLAELLSPAPAEPSAEPAEPVEAAEPEETQPAPKPVPAPEPQPEPEEPTMAAEPQPAGESPLATQATQATVNELQQKLSEAGRDIEDLKNSLVNMRRAFRQGLLMGAAMVLITALLALGAWALYNRFSGNGGSQAPATAQTAPKATSTDTVATPAPATTTTPPVTETVSETNYLSLIAQRHYGLPEYWVYIYEENIDKIDNPNRVKNGTVIVVPPPEKYGINAADPASVAKAKAKSTELYNLFKNKK